MRTIWFLLTTHCVCAWCKRRLRWAPLAFLNKPSARTTHTICRCCKGQVMTTLALLLVAFSLQAVPPAGFADRMADAIYIAEGGSKTKWPYGVKSIKARNAAHARQITINSVNNNWRRWEAAKQSEPFVKFMARRWVPESADPRGHANWVKNVNSLMNQKGQKP